MLAMIGILGYAGIRIAIHADDLFVRFAAGGITWFMVQALINLAVVLRMLPIAGVPLPLVSYGGSALVANLLAVGVLLAGARREPEARKFWPARRCGPNAECRQWSARAPGRAVTAHEPIGFGLRRARRWRDGRAHVAVDCHRP